MLYYLQQRARWKVKKKIIEFLSIFDILKQDFFIY